MKADDVRKTDTRPPNRNTSSYFLGAGHVSKKKKKIVCASILWWKAYLDDNPGSIICYTPPRTWAVS